MQAAAGTNPAGVHDDAGSEGPRPLAGVVAELTARLRWQLERREAGGALGVADRDVAGADNQTPPQPQPQLPPPEVYEMAAHASRARWGVLGDAIKRAERPPGHAVDGSKWMSLRLDGHGFSKHVKGLRRRGVIERDGFSDKFADAMQRACMRLMEATHAWLGYTQSDEMTVLIPPARVVRGVQQCHQRAGRVQKTGSLAATLVANAFNHRIGELWAEGGDGCALLPLELYAEFDCRVGVYDTQEEALALVLWRSYDSGINGAADACHHLRGRVDGAKQALARDHAHKLAWLHAAGRLPLHPHQAYGSLFMKEAVCHEGFNPKTQETVVTTRSKVVRQPRRCLVNAIVRGEVQYVDHRGEGREVDAEAAPGV